MNTDKIYAESIAKEYAPKEHSKIVALKKLDTRYTGLAQVTNWVKLCFAAMNLKKFAKWSWKDNHSNCFSYIISIFSPQYVLNPCLA